MIKRIIIVFLTFAIVLPSSAALAERAGTRIAFIALTDAYWQVFAINADGIDMTQLTHSACDKARVSWPAAADRLLVNTNQGELYIVHSSPLKEEKINIGMRGMTDAVWSANGKKVLFSLTIANSIDANDIFLVDISTMERKKLTNMKHLQHDPAWTYDEKQVVFLSGAGGQSHDIFVLDLAGSSVRQLTTGRLYHFEPACSVNNEIAFSSNRSGDYEIWVCDLEGKKFEQITHSPGLDAQPTWSPDGKKIAFMSTRSGRSAIWMVNRDGSNPRQLTPAHMLCHAPAWSR